MPEIRVALWLFCAVTTVTVGRSLAHILLPDGGAQSIATVPLDQFSAEGAAAVITSFALWGLSQLLLSVVMVLVAVRYRGLIPAMYLLILMEYLGRVGIGLGNHSQRWQHRLGCYRQSGFHCCRIDRPGAVLS